MQRSPETRSIESTNARTDLARQWLTRPVRGGVFSLLYQMDRRFLHRLPIGSRFVVVKLFRKGSGCFGFL